MAPPTFFVAVGYLLLQTSSTHHDVQDHHSHSQGHILQDHIHQILHILHSQVLRGHIHHNLPVHNLLNHHILQNRQALQGILTSLPVCQVEVQCHCLMLGGLLVGRQ